MKRLLTISLFVLLFSQVRGQHSPLLSQYMLNGLFLNPALTGQEDVLSVNTGYRSQWVGLEGAPQTLTLTADMPLKFVDKGAGGFLYYNDQIGVTSKNGFYTSFAYRTQVLGSSFLSLGLMGGVDVINSRWTEVPTTESGDPEFSYNDPTMVSPNFSFGFLFYRNDYSIGYSLPFFLTNDFSPGANLEIGNLDHHFWVGYNYVWRSDIIFKPTLLVRYNGRSPLQADINFDVEFKKRFDVGLSLRTGEALVLLLKYEATRQFRVAYSYDISFNPLRQYQSGSHEVSLRYRLKYKLDVVNPRFF